MNKQFWNGQRFLNFNGQGLAICQNDNGYTIENYGNLTKNFTHYNIINDIKYEIHNNKEGTKNEMANRNT